MVPQILFFLMGFAHFSFLMIRSLASDNSLARSTAPEPSLPHSAGDRGTENYMRIFNNLQEYMKEAEPFLRENCQLDDIARALCTNRSYVSRVIGECTGMSFPMFMNSYRVRYSMDLYKRNIRLRVTDLAAQSGFHNPVTFNLAFKACNGMTPGEWCTEYKEQIRRERLARREAGGPLVPGESAGPGERD